LMFGGPFGHQDLARREIAERDEARKRASLFVGQLGPESRRTQCVENTLFRHDGTPGKAKSPRASGGGLVTSVRSARVTKASIMSARRTSASARRRAIPQTRSSRR